jgi:uncharacterized RDD family membrane protein YckC
MEDFTLQTAENVPLHYDIATAGSRSAAFLIDYVIILIVMSGIIIIGQLSEALGDISSYIWAFLYLLVGTLLWVYFVISEMMFDGSSFGKKMLGIRVIKDDGSPIDLVDSLTRNFIRYVDLLPGTCLVGFLVMMFNDKSKRLGDFAAGTLVVRVRSVQLDKLYLEDTPYDAVVRNSPLSLITAEEYQLMRDYLTQRHRLPPYKSSTIASQLATRMAEKLHIDPPQDPDQRLQFIQSCVKYYEG